jgi:hypothetical protein
MPQEMERVNLSERMNRIGDLWCEFMHAAPMWPIHGQYECATCGRRRPVRWAEASEAI